MSLDFNSEKCSPATPKGKREALQREALVFASMAVGLSTITADNVGEWLVRLLTWEDLFGDSWLSWFGSPEVTAKALHRWIGLETNVDDETRDRWLRRLTSSAVSRAEARAEDVLGIPA